MDSSKSIERTTGLNIMNLETWHSVRVNELSEIDVIAKELKI